MIRSPGFFFPLLLVTLLFTACTKSSPFDKTTTHRNEVVQYAASLVGTPYHHAGKSPKTGFDCSGYTSFVFKKFGYSLGASSRTQYKGTSRISLGKMLPGDLCFFGNPLTRRINHVGIYVGNNRMLHVSTSRKRVEYADLSGKWYKDHYLGGGRILGE